MALWTSDYASFRTFIPSVLDWTGYTVTQIDDLIALGENKVYKFLRTRVMERSTTIALSSGLAAVPSDYIDSKFAYMDAAPVRRLQRKSAEWIYEHYSDRSSSGNEGYFAREAGNFIFGPSGASGSSMKLGYYGRGTALTSTINSIFSAHPDVFLYACVSEAASFIGQDSRLPVWEAKFKELIELANMEAKREDQSGSRLAATRS